jgi:dienelactone hydrolase
MVALGFLYATVFGQTTHVFRQGLASGSAHRYGRDAMYSDTLAHAMLSGQLAAPQAGATWYLAGIRQKSWTAVTADSMGLFRGPALNNGYLYLTWQSPKAQAAILTISGNSMVYVNGEPHAGDPYIAGYMHVPVMLKKGLNKLYVRCGFAGRMGGIRVSMELGGKPIRLSLADSTIPHLVKGISADKLWAGIVCLNSTGSAQTNLTVEATAEGVSIITPLPQILPLGTRKVPVQLPVPAALSGSGQTNYTLKLMAGSKVLDTLNLAIPQVQALQHQAHTFISNIDGSVQYYGVAPQQNGPTANPALFFSVHGAGVEGIGQARAYKPKPEGPLVAPTNRRPRGFNWEDWGRLDALEVLQIAKTRYQPNPQKIFLTGHSMGGHGTWFLGATYAGQWAAIAPCAGYPVLQQYGSADGVIPTTAQTPIRNILLRASNPSNILEMTRNYKAAGVYVFHGDDDRTVSVEYARQMRKALGEFHPDFAYNEYPGGSHWFGDISVDWGPLFDFFRSHSARQSARVHTIDFTTASPAISNSHYWINILQQEKSFVYSRIKLQRDTVKSIIAGTTENIANLLISPDAFAAGTKVKLTLDNQAIDLVAEAGKPWGLVRQNGTWQLSANAGMPANEKGPVRGGGLKEAFNHRMVFVYGTKGTGEENAWAIQKARYDAETWYYRGNGAVDVIPDTQFDDAATLNRGVVLYGNATTNTAYNKLMQDCEIKLERGKVQVGNKTYTGDDMGAYLVCPRQGSTVTSVAVIGGTGIKGMRAADANQYFTGGSGFPDFMIFSADMPLNGEEALRAAGYFNNQWKLGDDWVAQ